MDDDELTQDILDQFDLICTQHQQESTTSTTSGNHGLLNILQQNNHTKQIKSNNLLGRTTSLDLRVNSCTRTQQTETTSESAADFFRQDENARLKKEVAELREQLYMKLGELSTIKESANRLNATKSDVILRLESNLNVEREEFQRKLGELTTQLAFREADYRLVATELTRVKEQLSTTKSATPQDNLADSSPASQLIVSASTSLQQEHAFEPTNLVFNNHLPVAVTPCPSRRRTGITDGTWKIPIIARPEFPCSPSRRRLKPLDDNRPCDMETKQTSSGEAPIKRMRLSPHSNKHLLFDSHSEQVQTSDAAVHADFSHTIPVSVGSRKLSFRISQAPSSHAILSRTAQSKCPVILPGPFKLASELSRLGVFDEVECRSCVPDSTQIDGHPDLTAYLHSVDRYVRGFYMLAAPVCSESDSPTPIEHLRQLYAAIPHLLSRSEHVFKAIPSFCKNYTPKPAIDCSDRLPNFDSVDHAATDDDFDADDGIGYLGEDPFAGAPASQVVVPLKLKTVPKMLPSIPAKHVSSTAPARCTYAKPNLPRGKQPLVDLAFSCMRQLQSILHTLLLYQVFIAGSRSTSQSCDTNIANHLRPLGVIISDLIHGLADAFLSVWKKAKQFHTLSSLRTQIPTPSPILSVQTQSDWDNFLHLSTTDPASSVIVPPFLTALSLGALDLAVSLVFLISTSLKLGATQSDRSKDIVDCTPAFSDCFVLAHGCTYLMDQSNTQVDFSHSSSQPTPIVLFFRLFRSLSRYSSWNQGYHVYPWWETSPATTKDGQLCVQTEYFHGCFEFPARCRISVLAGWTRETVDQLTSSSRHSCSGSSECERTTEGEQQLVELLDEFSGFVSSLVSSESTQWPDNCSCKGEVYSTLIHVALVPLQCLLTIPSTSWSTDPMKCSDDAAEDIIWRTRLMVAFGQLIRALTGLRWRHGDSSFQTYTDGLPSYFFLISSLSNWIQQLKVLSGSNAYIASLLFGHEAVLRPELVEELFDFESSAEKYST